MSVQRIEPTTIDEVLSSPEKKLWEEAMQKMKSIKVVSAEFYFHKPMTVHLELYLFYCFIHFLLYIGQY